MSEKVRRLTLSLILPPLNFERLKVILLVSSVIACADSMKTLSDVHIKRESALMKLHPYKFGLAFLSLHCFSSTVKPSYFSYLFQSLPYFYPFLQNLVQTGVRNRPVRLSLLLSPLLLPGCVITGKFLNLWA